MILKLNFLHPYGPSEYFYRPSCEDICWVPNIHIISTVEQPELALATAAISSSSLNLFAVKSIRVFDSTANKFVYALIAESLSTLQAADTSQALVVLV